MSISFKKVIDFPNWQIYTVLDKTIKLPKTFRFVYWDSDNKKVIVFDRNDFDFELVFSYGGFIFCQPNAQVPKIMFEKTDPMKSSVLISANLNKHILESKPSKIILNFIPGNHSNPIFDTNIIVRFDEEKGFENIDAKNLIKEIVEKQRNKNSKDWYNNILKNCPEIHYQEIIKDSDFKKKIENPKFKIKYDFKSENDFELLTVLEDKFVDLKSKIKIYEDISGKYKFVKSYCQKNKIQFTDGVTNKIKFIEMKYSDFLKVKGLNPTISCLLD